ncbi:TetR/AcrR family transcriptional regulator [Virgibacillus dokdonensis]|uniref:Fatty acid metabolism regulator protein n=1 Tax=Virgibacillus dokdonensis TaxID=302167 RepID=A0A2K9J1D2_9BACI|nr:TetR/AcrR family transcriptional regulator [Virgibacillus dokdonensis]AUJ25524.1 Fatty acid metabolism regulator protein [Virgibacillus dokdonensis]
MSLREKKVAEKKEEIIRMAIRVLSEKGYNGITMEEIAAKLLMTKGTVYYYFKDKQELLYQSQIMLLERSLWKVQQIQQKQIPIDKKLNQSIISHIEYILEERSGFELMLKPEQIFNTKQLDVIFKLRDTYAEIFDQMITEGIDEGTFDVTDVKVVRNIILGSMNWVTQWYAEDGEKSRTEIAEDIAIYLLRMLSPNK